MPMPPTRRGCCVLPVGNTWRRRATRGYQGYFGPGWKGHVMIPIEYAFETPTARALENIPPTLLGRVMDSPALFSEALQLIPRQAEAIQRELNRAVWNGNVRQSCGQRRAAQVSTHPSKTLLWNQQHRCPYQGHLRALHRQSA
jgi:hypothetical protein